MKHEFFVLNDIDRLSQPRWFIGLPESIINSGVSLPDEIIVNNPLFMKGFKTYKVYFKNPGEGLDYWGVTIIPSSSMLDFQANLNEVKKQNHRKKTLIALIDKLIVLTNEVLDKNEFLIHFGI